MPTALCMSQPKTRRPTKSKRFGLSLRADSPKRKLKNWCVTQKRTKPKTKSVAAISKHAIKPTPWFTPLKKHLKKKKVEEALAACKKAIEEKEIPKIKSTMEALTQASHKLAEIMYKQASSQQGGASPDTGGAQSDTGSADNKKKKDEKVVDAEFEENPPK